MNISQFLHRQRPTLVLAAAVAIVLLLIGDSPGAVDLSITIAVFSLLALSVALCYGQAGIMSVAQAGFAAIGAYATAIMATRWELHPLIGLVAALLVPAVIAYPLARIVGRLSHLALAIATLVFGEIVVILLREGGDFTGGYVGLSGIPPLPWAIDLQTYSVFAWVVVVVVVAGYSNLVASSHGRALQTIRWDDLRARADGVEVAHRSAGIFALAAAVAGLAGWLYAHYLAFLAPESIPAMWSITAILMAVVGGKRYVLGPVLGAAVLMFLQNALPSEAAQGILYGSALVAALVLAPEGLLGIAERLWRSATDVLRGRRRPPEPDPPSAPGSPMSRADYTEVSS